VQCRAALCRAWGELEVDRSSVGNCLRSWLLGVGNVRKRFADRVHAKGLSTSRRHARMNRGRERGSALAANTDDPCNNSPSRPSSEADNFGCRICQKPVLPAHRTDIMPLGFGCFPGGARAARTPPRNNSAQPTLTVRQTESSRRARDLTATELGLNLRTYVQQPAPLMRSFAGAIP
jgi:hypothetical protein